MPPAVRINRAHTPAPAAAVVKRDPLEDPIEALRAVLPALRNRIMTIPPGEIPDAAIGAIALTVSEIRRAFGSRYDAVREEVLKRVRAIGQTSFDNDGVPRRVHASFNGWDVQVTIKTPHPNTSRIAQLLSGKPQWYVRIVKRTEPACIQCETCGGTGKRWVPEQMTIDEDALREACRHRVLPAAEVWKGTEVLQEVRPPQPIAAKIAAIVGEK